MKNLRKKMSVIVALIVTVTSLTVAQAIEAIPTTSTIYVNGTEVKVNAYNIDGNNYFKLRDVAYMLNGTPKQFSVDYNGALNSIVLTSDKSYTVVGGEMEQGGEEVVDTEATSSKIVKDGDEIEMTAYNINGSNYFKLRELGEKFNFEVGYDENTNSVNVDTGNKKDTTMIDVPNAGDDPNFTVSVPLEPIDGEKYYMD